MMVKHIPERGGSGYMPCVKPCSASIAADRLTNVFIPFSRSATVEKTF